MKTTIRTCIIALLLIILPLQLKAQALVDADNAYAAAEYERAVSLYQQAIDEGAVTAEVYYNMGCAYYKLEQFASAILAFERAHVIDPSDSDIKYNLALAHSKSIDKIDSVAINPFARATQYVAHLLGLSTWLVLGVASFVLAAVLLLIYFFASQRRVRIFSFYGAIALVVVSLLSNLLVWRSYVLATDTSQAILMKEIITIKSAPDQSSKDIVVVHSGLKVTILQELNGFVEVRLPDATVGWVPNSDLEVINIFTTK